MASLTEKPLPPIRPETPGEAREHVAAVRRSDEKAQCKSAWREFAQEFTGSYRACEAAILAALKSGDLPHWKLQGKETLESIAPCYQTVSRWLKGAAGIPGKGHNAKIADHKITRRRARKQLVTELQLVFDELIASGATLSVPKFRRALEDAAKGKDWWIPSPEELRRRIGEVPHAKRVTARHGKRAAIADAILHGHVRADYATQVYTLDEFELPVWVQAYSWVAGRHVAVKVSVVIVVDNASGVIVGYFVANPLIRDALRKQEQWDVKAALASAMIPELATPATHEFSGWMPATVRMDNHPTHSPVRKDLRAIIPKVANLPGYAPWSRGIVEGAVRILKAETTLWRGHEDRYQVAEYADAKSPEETMVAAGTTARVTERDALLVRQLYTLSEIRDKVEALVYDYNYRLVHEEWGMPRAAMWRERFREKHEAPDGSVLYECRSGRDSITFLEPARLLVKESGGLRVSKVRFQTRTSTARLIPGERIDIRVDPALRAVFHLDAAGELHVFYPVRDKRAALDPAAVAHAIHAEAHAHEESVRAVRAALRDREVGVAGAEVADAVADLGLDFERLLKEAHQETRRTEQRERRARKRPAPATPEAPPPAPPAVASRPAPSPAAPRVIPITQAPSHRGASSTAPVAPLRRGIVRAL